MIKIKPFTQTKQFSIGLSVKCSLLALILFSFSSVVKAQPGFYNGSGGTSYNASPLNDGTNNKVQWIYGPNLFKSAGTTGTVAPKGTITKIYFRLGTTVNGSASYTNFTISLGQNQGTSTTWSSTTFASGLTNVYSKSSQTLSGATASSWYGITLNTPFYYDPAQSLVFELKVSAGTGNTIAQTIVGGNQRIYGGYAGTTGTLNTGLVDFGFDIVKASQNDLSAIGVTNGLSNTCGISSDPLFVQIKNTGIIDLASGQNIPVTTVVSGAGSATFNKFFNKSLKAGSTDTLHMGYLNTASFTGNLNLKSTISYIPTDSVRSNDTNFTTRSFLGSTKVTPGYTFTTVCDTVKFTNTTKDPCNAVTSYKWDFDNGKNSTAVSPKFSYNSPGTYNVKLLVFYASGFKDSVTRQVIVYAKPQANFNAINQCLGVAIDFSNFSFGVNTYKWSFGDATTSTSANPNRTYTTAGAYQVKLVATNGNNCKDSITKSVTVYSKPVAGFSVTNACEGSNAYINNSSTGGASYSWDLGDGTASSFFNPAKIYSLAGSYGIILTVTSAQGCTDKTTKTATIHPLPVANFNVQNNCKGIATSFSNTSTGANTYDWAFGDLTKSTSFSPSKTYINASTYNVTLTVTSSNGCTHSVIKPVTIYALPNANFSANDVCIGLNTDFSNLSTLPNGGGDYIWRFGDGNVSSLANPSYKYGTPGGYDVHLVAISSFGCKDSAIANVAVFDKPIPSFSAVDVCAGQAVKFINNSSGTVSQTWDYGDGTSDNGFSPSHTYAGPDLYKVVLTVTSPNNCKETYEKSVTVRTNPEVVFSVGDHCHGTDATFANFSVGAASFTWKFGDGDSSKSTQANHKYLAAGTYSVKLKGVSAKGCSVEQTKSVKVFPRPVPAFSASTVCHGLSTQFTNSSTGASTYMWNLGDGSGSSTANNPSYQYTNPGNYKVILTAVSSDNCKEDLAKTITVASLPIPIFLVQDVCSGVEVKPTNSSQGVITSQKWNFGDGKSDTSRSPSHIYSSPGIYKIQLKLTSGLGCTDSTSKTILIYTQPLIKISENIVISKGYSTKLLASGGTDYLWSPAESLDNPLSASPTATPQGDTRYSVKVMNAFGCFDTASVYVSLKTDFAIEPQNLITPNANGQNDFWKIKGIEFYHDANVMIFDQWGRIIFEQTNYENNLEKGWNGTMDGKPLPDGTYFYVITLPGTERQYKGTINILKN